MYLQTNYFKSEYNYEITSKICMYVTKKQVFLTTIRWILKDDRFCSVINYTKPTVYNNILSWNV